MAADVTPHLWDLQELLVWEVPYCNQTELN